MDGHVDVTTLTSAEVGRLGEQLCANFLERRGLEVVERNWVCPAGEADVIANDDGTCVLVEVKTRVDLGGHVLPELAVDDTKRSRYERIARVYLSTHDNVENVRFDVAGVTLAPDHVAHLHYISGVWLGDA